MCDVRVLRVFKVFKFFGGFGGDNEMDAEQQVRENPSKIGQK